MVIDGPINREAFVAYVEQVLAPELQPGDIVIMDNLSSHKASYICEAIEAAVATLRFLPRLLPRLQPDRKSLLEAEGPPAQGLRTHHPRPLDRHRPHPRPLHPTGMRQRLQRLRP